MIELWECERAVVSLGCWSDMRLIRVQSCFTVDTDNDHCESFGFYQNGDENFKSAESLISASVGLLFCVYNKYFQTDKNAMSQSFSFVHLILLKFG